MWYPRGTPAHYATLKAAVEATIASRTTAEWKTVLDARGVPAFTPGPPTAAFGSEANAILKWAGFNERDVHRLVSDGAVTPTAPS